MTFDKETGETAFVAIAFGVTLVKGTI